MRGQGFIGNDSGLDQKDSVWMITGPNMGGKSTFLRQTAIISILAQTGSFVPAEKATLGVFDRIMSRIGASDDLASNLSTFMVEMTETAAILSLANESTLVIMDEVGRGTSTMDGLAIAYAVLEHLVNKSKSIVLFATHFHELVPLVQHLGIGYRQAAVFLNNDGDLTCLFKLIPGVMDKSHGIHIAQKAGLPTCVIQSAGNMYRKLSKSHK